MYCLFKYKFLSIFIQNLALHDFKWLQLTTDDPIRSKRVPGWSHYLFLICNQYAHEINEFPRNLELHLDWLFTRRLSTQQQSPSSHYYVQHSGTGSRRIMPRSGSDQHLPHTEYTDYTSITQAGRHSLLRSSLKSGSTLSRYNQRYVDQSSGGGQMGQPKYGPPSSGQYSTGGATMSRRNRSSLDYSSDTEATIGPRTNYYYYRWVKPRKPLHFSVVVAVRVCVTVANLNCSRNQSAVPHSTIPTLGRNNSLTSTDIAMKFNSLPRDTRASTRWAVLSHIFDCTTCWFLTILLHIVTNELTIQYYTIPIYMYLKLKLQMNYMVVKSGNSTTELCGSSNRFRCRLTPTRSKINLWYKW